MDYHRIYREFIADRKSKPKPEGYTERHHILPRSLGGGDDTDNLIDLTAEDHFFAHLLLAKMHGGRMWAPVAFMVGGQRRGWKPIRSRREYGWAKRQMGEACSGEGAHQYDWAEYRLLNIDGRSWSGRQSEMTSLGFTKSLANMLIKGRVKSAKGWYLEGNPAPSRSGSAHPAYNAEQILFRHVDGAEFFGTAFELSRHAGIPRDKAANIRSGRQRVSGGWYRDGYPPLPIGRGAKLPGADASGDVRLRHKDGRVFEGTRREAIERLGLPSGGNLAMVLNGKRSHTKGWAVAT